MSLIEQQSEIERMLRSYFHELDAALASVPEPGREQLVSEIRAHVDDALAHKPPTSPWDVRELLQRVGTPRDIADAAIYFLSLGSAPVTDPGAGEKIPPSESPVSVSRRWPGPARFSSS
jgi:hypothetical protein